MNEKKNLKDAVVIGGSIAGLLAARVLAEHFENVIILEKDTLPTEPEAHKSVPQGNHIHVILGQGQDFLESRFPGILKEIENSGGNIVDFSKDISWFFQGSWRTRHTSGMTCLLSLRPHTEWHVRRRLLAEYPNVTIRENSLVEGLLTDDKKTWVTGVKLKYTNSEPEEITADLTVDSSGRGSQTPQWLEQMGYHKPREAEIGIGLCYTSRIYNRPDNFNEDWKLLALFPKFPDSWRGGILSSVQDNQWIVTMNGYFGEVAPVDDHGFLQFASSLPKPDIYNWIKNETPVSATKVFKVPKIRRRYYEELSKFPDGLIVIGDANCIFNPIFGQGITAASRYSWQLDECLSKLARKSPGSMKNFSKTFQKKLTKHLDLPWFLTTMIDLSYPQTKGNRPPGMLLISWFFRQVLETCSKNARVNQSFMKVLHMYAGLGTLLKPSFFLPVLFYGIKSSFVPLAKRADIAEIPRQMNLNLSTK